MAQTVCLPMYSFYIIGGVYFILFSYIIYLLYLLFSNKRKFYKSFELGETFEAINKNVDKCKKSKGADDKKPLILQGTTYKCDVEKVNTEIHTEISVENIIETNVDNKKERRNENRDLQIVKNNNPNVIALISPDEMKNLCEGVLKKIGQKKDNLDSTVTKFEINQNDIQLNKEENFGKKLNKSRKSVSVSNLYDVVKHPQPVSLKILSQDDITLLFNKRKNPIIIRDTLTQYMFPLSARKTIYVNA